MAELAPQIQAIVQGDVEDITFDSQECEGPRTVIHLSAVSTLLGDPHDSKMTLRVFGGPLPNGSFVSASELPRYVLGAHYILVLRNTDWRFSPVIGDLAFRAETIAGKQVLVDTDGHGVTGISDSGVDTATPQLTEPVGLNRKASLPRGLPAPESTGGTTTPCRGRECPPVTDGGEGARAEAIRASGRFAHPQLLASTNAAAVASAIDAGQFVKQMGDWVNSHATHIGGYYAVAPKIGCWDQTPVSRARHR
jgi:hypothetical protein